MTFKYIQIPSSFSMLNPRGCRACIAAPISDCPGFSSETLTSASA